jgi:hypothetical protein
MTSSDSEQDRQAAQRLDADRYSESPGAYDEFLEIGLLISKTCWLDRPSARGTGLALPHARGVIYLFATISSL